MFRLDDQTSVTTAVTTAEKNYVIQKNDILKLKVFTNAGELLIDPEYQLMKDVQPQTISQRPDPQYLVDTEGLVRLPMVGEINVEGLTVREAEFVLQKEYSKYYTNVFVKLEYTNRRVVVLGAPGGQVIPLVNENLKLTEVLALAGGLDNNASAQNIRILRDDQVFVANLTTVDGFNKGNMVMQHGDVIYVEPIRRPVSEGVRDYGPLLSIVTSLTTLIIVLIGL
jgi:polysaccharide export outer membrane protein